MPAPLILHMFGGGDKGIREGALQGRRRVLGGSGRGLRAEVKALVEAGATYIQFDDTSIAFLCDPMHRETVQRWGRIPTSCCGYMQANKRGARRDCPNTSR